MPALPTGALIQDYEATLGRDLPAETRMTLGHQLGSLPTPLRRLQDSAGSRDWSRLKKTQGRREPAGPRRPGWPGPVAEHPLYQARGPETGAYPPGRCGRECPPRSGAGTTARRQADSGLWLDRPSGCFWRSWVSGSPAPVPGTEAGWGCRRRHMPAESDSRCSAGMRSGRGPGRCRRTRRSVGRFRPGLHSRF